MTFDQGVEIVETVRDLSSSVDATRWDAVDFFIRGLDPPALNDLLFAIVIRIGIGPTLKAVAQGYHELASTDGHQAERGCGCEADDDDCNLSQREYQVAQQLRELAEKLVALGEQ